MTKLWTNHLFFWGMHRAYSTPGILTISARPRVETRGYGMCRAYGSPKTQNNPGCRRCSASAHYVAVEFIPPLTRAKIQELSILSLVEVNFW